MWFHFMFIPAGAAGKRVTAEILRQLTKDMASNEPSPLLFHLTCWVTFPLFFASHWTVNEIGLDL